MSDSATIYSFRKNSLPEFKKAVLALEKELARLGLLEPKNVKG